MHSDNHLGTCERHTSLSQVAVLSNGVARNKSTLSAVRGVFSSHTTRPSIHLVSYIISICSERAWIEIISCSTRSAFVCLNWTMCVNVLAAREHVRLSKLILIASVTFRDAPLLIPRHDINMCAYFCVCCWIIYRSRPFWCATNWSDPISIISLAPKGMLNFQAKVQWCPRVYPKHARCVDCACICN